MTTVARRPLVPGLTGLVILIGLWQLLTATVASGNILWPTRWR